MTKHTCQSSYATDILDFAADNGTELLITRLDVDYPETEMFKAEFTRKASYEVGWEWKTARGKGKTALDAVHNLNKKISYRTLLFADSNKKIDVPLLFVTKI